jgi:hypothetical protein
MGKDTFPGDPNPPPKPPKARTAPPASEDTATLAAQGEYGHEDGQGNFVSPVFGESQDQGGATEPPPPLAEEQGAPDATGGPLPKQQFFVTNDPESGKSTIYVDDADHGVTPFSEVRAGEDAQKILEAQGTYNEASKSWDIPETVAKALAQGRPTPAAFWKASYDAGEAATVIGQNGVLFLEGKMTKEEVLAANHLPTLKAQLAEAPGMAWTGKDGIAAEMLKNPATAIAHGAEKAVGEAASWISAIKEVTKTALEGSAIGAAASVPVALTTAGATAVAPPVAAVAAAGTIAGGATLGATAGTFVALTKMEAGNMASDWLTKGIPDEQIKKWAPVGGAVKAALWMGGFKYLPMPYKERLIGALAESPIAQKAMANWVVRYAGESVGAGGLMAAQSAVGSFLNNMVATVANRPDLLEDPEKAAMNALEAGIGGMAGTAVLGAPGVAMERMGARADTKAETAKAAEVTTSIEKYKAERAAEQAPAAPAEAASTGEAPVPPPEAPPADKLAGVPRAEDLPKAGSTVDGRTVRASIPNQDSIGASLNDYEVLPGVREVPLDAFETKGKPKYATVNARDRAQSLAEQIKASGEINPLIVVEDKDGYYILEGGHRFDALRELGAKSFPALVVKDLEAPREAVAPVDAPKPTPKAEAPTPEKAVAGLVSLGVPLEDAQKTVEKAAKDAAAARNDPEARLHELLDQHEADKTGAVAPEVMDEADRLLEQLGPGATPEERAAEAAKATGSTEAPLDKAGRESAVSARVTALESELHDTQWVIDDLVRLREEKLKKASSSKDFQTSTRKLDAILEARLKEREGIKQDLAYYKAEGKNAEKPAKGERLEMKPATLDRILEMGFKEGRKDVMTSRAQRVKAVADQLSLSQADLRKLLKNKNIGLMSDAEFNNWLERGATRDGEHIPSFKEQAAEVAKRKIALTDTLKVQKDRGVKREQYIRQLNDLPPVQKMTRAELYKYIDILKTYDKGDEALSPERVRALNTGPAELAALRGSRTMEDVRERAPKLTGQPLTDFKNTEVPLRAAATPDAQLRRSHPALRPFVDLAHQFTQKGRALAERAKEPLFQLWADAIAERRKQQGIGERLVDFFAPQQREVMAYIENPTPDNATKLTPAELRVAEFWRTWAKGAEDYYIKRGKIEEATRFSSKYAPHVARDFFEIVRDAKKEGIWKSLKELALPRIDDAQFSQKGNFMGFDKMAKFLSLRSGELTPSKNMARVMASHMDTFYNMVTQDQIAPVLDTLARSLRPEDGDPKAAAEMNSAIENFTKMYANNKKGINNAGGVVDALAAPALQLGRTLAAIHYIQGYYALQATVATVKMLPGEFMALGTDLATAKVRKYSADGRAILEKYSSFVGKGPMDSFGEPGKGLKETLGLLGSGIFGFAHKTAMEDVLLGSMTKEEFAAGGISDKRLAEIKLNAGRWLDMEGMSSIAGSTEFGKSATQLKRWMVPPTLSLAEDANALWKSVRGQDKLKPEQIKDLARIGTLAGFAVLSGFALTKDQEDDSFTGHLIHYIRNDIHAMWAGINPAVLTATPVGIAYIQRIATDLQMLVHLQQDGSDFTVGDRYKKTSQGHDEGDSKGAAALKKDLTPAFIAKNLPSEDN